MPTPEVWGPAVWRLFHTLAERINEHAYPHLSSQLFKLIFGICKFLPCPDCSSDAVRFLAKIKPQDLKTKTEFKNMIYLFHNYVNVKKRKPLFNYANINVYKNYRLLPILNNFIIHYNTKGNMKLLAETFQRQFVVKECRKWIYNNIAAFVPPFSPVKEIQNCDFGVTLKDVVTDNIIVELNSTEKILEKEPFVREEILEEPVEEQCEASLEVPVEQEELVEEPLEEPFEESVEHEELVEEPLEESEEHVEQEELEELEEEPKKESNQKKKKRKNKNKK